MTLQVICSCKKRHLNTFFANSKQVVFAQVNLIKKFLWLEVTLFRIDILKLYKSNFDFQNKLHRQWFVVNLGTELMF